MTPALLIRTSVPPSSFVHTLGRRDKCVPVSHVCLNGDRLIAKLSCEGLDPVDPAGKQCEPVSAGGQGAGCRRADP